jgi:hypothetical protein
MKTISFFEDDLLGNYTFLFWGIFGKKYLNVYGFTKVLQVTAISFRVHHFRSELKHL